MKTKINTINKLKGNKLPKKYWSNGKSKFLFARCRQEGIEIGQHLFKGGESAMSALVKKLD